MPSSFKRAQPFIQLTVVVMRYLNGIRTFHLTKGIEDIKIIKWYVEASYGVHEDFRSHTGSVMPMGTGALQAGSAKQKLNTRSNTEVNLVGVDDVIATILWTKLFIEELEYEVKRIFCSRIIRVRFC